MSEVIVKTPAPKGDYVISYRRVPGKNPVVTQSFFGYSAQDALKLIEEIEPDTTQSEIISVAKI